MESILQFLVGVVVLFVTFCVCSSDELQLNSQAELISDVKSIHHNKDNHQIVIYLSETRNCTQPTFMIRLSGTSLYILDPVHDISTRPNTAVFSYPNLIDSGTYFTEVLTLYCETVNPNKFANICLVSPQAGNNVLTLPYSFEVRGNVVKSEQRPRWVLAHNSTPAILPTRYQKLCGKEYCKSFENETVQHNFYEWVNKPPYVELLKETLEWSATNMSALTGSETITFCMVGASHSSYLVSQGQNLNLSRVQFVHIESRYPQQFHLKLLENCSYAVIGYGQWPLSSWQRSHPYTADRYGSLMRALLNTVKTARLSTQVFTRSMNLNGFGASHTACPAKDFRHPPLVWMYNSVLANVSAEVGVEFINMHHIQAPLWDIALDWSHCIGRVYDAEIEFIVHSALSYSHKQRRAPLLDPNVHTRAHRNTNNLIRFTNSSKLYQCTDGTCRLFHKDDKNMYSLGLDKRHITVVDSSLRKYEKFGPPLPPM